MPTSMFSRALAAVASALLIGGVVMGGTGVAFAGEGSHGGTPQNAIFVANTPNSGGGGCATAPFTTIQAAVAAATPGQTVIVCHGTYTGEVAVAMPLVLHGLGATINATGSRNGVLISSSNVTVEGFTVTGALSEGILAEPAGAVTNPAPPTSASKTLAPISNVSIRYNAVNDNNLGGTGPDRQCPGTPAPPLFLYPGDCGGGIHLDTVAGSRVDRNVTIGNDDGILITDDYGPAFGNVVRGNYVADNLYECGIVLPSHNGFSVTATQNPDGTFTVGALTPTTGGVYNNTVADNAVIDNGTAPSPAGPGTGASGSGIGVFAPSAGTASYNNTIAHNFITGNGQSGFTIHAHYPGGEYISGNKVIANVIGPNNLGGDFLDGPGTDPDTMTTGVLIFSAEPVHMVIAANHIFGNQIGIWLTPTVQAAGLASNKITGATTPIYLSRVPYAFTGPALNTTAATATVGVLVNPNGVATTYYVEYGATAAYGSQTAPASAGSGILPAGFPVQLSGITAGETVHYQVVATNANGTRMGGDMTFTAT